jgi:hypothetical protein
METPLSPQAIASYERATAIEQLHNGINVVTQSLLDSRRKDRRSPGRDRRQRSGRTRFRGQRRHPPARKS